MECIKTVKQKLSGIVINTFYALVYLQNAIVIKIKQINTLQEHLVFIEKKASTGSATQYEILTTKVKMSVVESQRTDLEAAQNIQLSVLNSLLGKPTTSKHVFIKEVALNLPSVTQDSLLNCAFSNRDEIKTIIQKQNAAKLQYKYIKASDNPTISGLASTGWKNGYIPDLKTPTYNYAIGIGLKIPIYSGIRIRSSLQMIESGINSCNSEIENSKRTITNEVIEALANVKASQTKIEHFKVQLAQSQEAIRLAQLSLNNGAVTNLDLLDATTNVSETELLLLKSEIDLTVNIYKLKSALGERLY